LLCAGQEQALPALTSVRNWMSAHALALREDKTQITQFKEGFTFLGVYFVDEQAYTPWKGSHTQGRILAMARPMPPVLLARCAAAKHEEPAFGAALRHAMEEPERRQAVSGPSHRGNGRTRFVAFLYLTEQGSVLRKSGDRFLVEKEGQVLLDLPYHKLESILIFGNIQVTTQALGELMETGIAVSFLSRNGRYRGSVSTPQGNDIQLRLAQFRCFAEAARALELARAQIEAKIANSLEVLRTHHGGSEPPEAAALLKLGGEAKAAPNLEVLLGVEGAATRSYFDAAMKLNRSAFEWHGRQSHPPPDPLNAMLSLAYTLLANELRSLVEAHGLDSGLGCLHQPDFGRPSLAYDLVEPFRAPVADRFVLTQINRKVFEPGDFQPHAASGGVRLTPEALVRFLEGWERWMLARPLTKAEDAGPPSLRRELRREVERVVRWLHEGGVWTAWRWDRVETAEERDCDSSSVTT
jgi:CRISPR-associated protein Cas1